MSMLRDDSLCSKLGHGLLGTQLPLGGIHKLRPQHIENFHPLPHYSIYTIKFMQPFLLHPLFHDPLPLR